MEYSSSIRNESTQKKSSDTERKLSCEFKQMHMLTERFLLSTDPEGLGHLGASILALLRSVSKTALTNPEHKDYIIKNIEGLTKHASENISKLRSPINILSCNSRRKIQLNKELIAEGFEPAINDIKIGREYDPFRNMERSDNKADCQKKLKNIKIKNNDIGNNYKSKQSQQINLPSI